MKDYPSIELVHLNLDYGGLVSEANKLSDIVKNKKLSTVVSDECVSACTLVFLAGEQRILKKYARLGFHSFSSPRMTNDPHFISSSKQYYTRLGLDDDFVEKIFSTDPSDMWYPATEMLIKENLVTKVVNEKELNLQETNTDLIRDELRSFNSQLEDLEDFDEDDIKKRQSLNEQALKEFSKLIPRAKSSAALRFVEISKRQNEIAQRSVEIHKDISTITQEMKNFSQDVEDLSFEDSIILVTKHAIVCGLASENISILEEIVEILDEKIDILGDPAVLEEFMINDARIIEAGVDSRSHHKRLIVTDKKIFADMECLDY